MSNDNLHNALNRLGADYAPGPDFTATIMAKVKRRARRRRIINIALVSLCGLVVVATATYLLTQVLSPVIATATALPHSLVLPICGLSALLCLMLLADTLLRQKFMPNS